MNGVLILQHENFQINPGEKESYLIYLTISNVTAFNTDPFNTFKSI